jgi:hypothetical protein
MLDVSGAPGAGDGYELPELDANCEGDFVIVTGNGMPTYQFVQMTPNPLVAQDYRFEIPRSPAMAEQPTDLPLLGLAGVAVNGLVWFGPNEAGQPEDSAWGDPIDNGLTDPCTGHTAGEYHYHALTEKCLLQSSVSSSTPWTLPDALADEPSPVVGFALDGFPIYGPRGCMDLPCTDVRELLSGWEQIGDPTTYAWDAYAFVEHDDAVHLDRCNGRVQPDGSYGYHATAGFPYILGCYTGTPTDAAGNQGGGDDDDGPASCEDEGDCVGECPDGSLGCTCAEGPMGSVCVPTCERDEDCPDGGMDLECDEGNGICVPAGGPPQ